MFSFDQIATHAHNIDQSIAALDKVGHRNWIRDDVEAVHLYANPTYDLGERFKVKLAFNYEVFEGKEFELIELSEGSTVQLLPSKATGLPQGISHFGYHVVNPEEAAWNDTLVAELHRLQLHGIPVSQVSQTVAHSNTRKRYRYAFAHLPMLGAPIKVIQRLPMDMTVDQGKEAYAWLSSKS